MSRRLKSKHIAIGVVLLLLGYIYLGRLTLPLYRQIYKHKTQAAFNDANTELGSPLSYAHAASSMEGVNCSYTAPPRAFERRLGCFQRAYSERVLNSAADEETFYAWLDTLHHYLQQNQWAATLPNTPSGGTWKTANTKVILDFKSDHSDRWVKYSKSVKGNGCTLSIQTYTKTLEDGTLPARIVSVELYCGRSTRLP